MKKSIKNLNKLRESKNKERLDLISKKSKLIKESFHETFNKIKRIDESNLDEYDYDMLDRKYSSMDKERKDKLVSWGKERQIRNGVIFRSDENEARLSIIPNNIVIHNDKILDEYYKRVEAYKKGGNRDYKFSQYISQLGTVTFNLEARNSISIGSDNDDNVSSKTNNIVGVDIKLIGRLEPLTDKDWPKLRFNVISTKVEYHGAGRLIPEDRKGANIITNKIKEVFLGKYGKYSTPNMNDSKLFIPEINLHPNSLIN